jgi:uncharacterized membrane-anchored protein
MRREEPMRQVMMAAVLAAAGLHAAWAAPSEQEARQAMADAVHAATNGPADVTLKDEAVLHLPAGEVFVPRPQAQRLLEVMGNPGEDPQLQGLIVPRGERMSWFMIVRFVDAGYVKDDDARNWNAEDLLESFRAGTAEANKEREKMGVPGLEILGWAEVPRYDAARQRLVWAMKSREIGAKPDEPLNVNYNTYALGRDGYFTMNLVTGLDELPGLKPMAERQLAALEYDAGKRYADFQEGHDHVAEYGLAALVVGVAAHKLGFIALAGALLAKFAKVILVGLAVAGGGIARLFKRKS